VLSQSRVKISAMTSIDAPTPAAPRNRGMARLAAGLGFVCLVLFLLAIEQKQAVAAWSVVREEVAPAVGDAAGWAIDGGPGGLSGLQDAVRRNDTTLTADSGDRALTGEFDPVDEATRDAVGTATFIGASIRLEKGDSFRTQPMRIVPGRESFVAGQTFADRLAAAPDAQIELRRIVPVTRGSPVAATSLCGGEVPGVVALLHRQGRLDMLMFRTRTIVGPDAPADALCGVWHFRAR